MPSSCGCPISGWRAHTHKILAYHIFTYYLLSIYVGDDLDIVFFEAHHLDQIVTEDIEVLAHAVQRLNTIAQTGRVSQDNEQSFVARSVARREREYGGHVGVQDDDGSF